MSVTVSDDEDALFSKSGDKSENDGGVIDSCDSDLTPSRAFNSFSSVSSNDSVSRSEITKFLMPELAYLRPVWVYAEK